MLDLDAYLARIGLSGLGGSAGAGPNGGPTIAEVHRAHATTIVFENLDSHRGVPVSLEPRDIERKLVRAGRGGYCFEQNLLLAAALEAMGAEVDMYLARVRYGAPPGTIRPRSHLVLRVRGEGEAWHADVGFGRGTQLEPLPWGPGAEHEQSGWRFRIVRDGEELVLQTIEPAAGGPAESRAGETKAPRGEEPAKTGIEVEGAEDTWVDLYGFLEHPVEMVDVETINWWVSTHPRSPFVTGLIACSLDDDGTCTWLSDWGELALTEYSPAGKTMTPVAREEIPGLLAERFGLAGYERGPDGRIEERS